MKAKAASIAFAAALALSAFGGSALAGNGQKIGQDPVRLALTVCSNAGTGNGGEYEILALRRSLLSDCLNERFGSRLSSDEIAGILAQSDCELFLASGVCEIDPGNSADHNNAEH